MLHTGTLKACDFLGLQARGAKQTMASFSYPDSCAYAPSDLTIFKMKVVEDMATLTDKESVLAFLLER